jgi:hypothetical protein
VNRRSFLLGLGMVACSGTVRPAPRPKRRVPSPTPDEPTSGGDVDLIWFESQLQASPLAFHGDVLVQSFGGELRSWDAAAMKRTDTWTLPHRHFCFVQDGTLVAFGWPARDVTSVIHRIASGKVRSENGPVVPPSRTIVLLPARTPDELFVADEDSIYRLTATEVEEILPHPYPNGATRDQWISRGDGRLIGGRNGALYLVASKAHSTEYRIPHRYLMHLAAGTGERVWYSYAEGKHDWDAHTLVLAPMATPMAHERLIDVAPARIVHLASCRDTVAAVLTVMGQTRADFHWKVAVFDEAGNQRWRVEVPYDVNLAGALNHSFIAIGEHRVVLASPDGNLLAWDAADGTAIEV